MLCMEVLFGEASQRFYPQGCIFLHVFQPVHSNGSRHQSHSINLPTAKTNARIPKVHTYVATNFIEEQVHWIHRTIAAKRKRLCYNQH